MTDSSVLALLDESNVEDAVQAAVDQLTRSGRGQNALRRLLEWLDDDGLGLDAKNQDAVFVLLLAAWGPPPTETPSRQTIEVWLIHFYRDGHYHRTSDNVLHSKQAAHDFAERYNRLGVGSDAKLQAVASAETLAFVPPSLPSQES